MGDEDGIFAATFSKLTCNLACRTAQVCTKSQSKSFGKIVNKIKLKQKTIIERDFGMNIEDVGVHSWRSTMVRVQLLR